MGNKKFGFIALDRGIFDHVVLNKNRGPFSDVEAFAWLVINAAWRDDCERGVNVRRGQVVGTIRGWGKLWNWPPTRVFEFLQRHRAEHAISLDKIRPRTIPGTIRRTIGRGVVTVITICNYEKHQGMLKRKKHRAEQLPEQLPEQLTLEAVVEASYFPPKHTKPDSTIKKESGERTKPAHGACSRDGKFVWFDHGTEEWTLHAADFKRVRRADLLPEGRIGGRGNWFVYLGEEMRPKQQRKRA